MRTLQISALLTVFLCTSLVGHAQKWKREALKFQKHLDAHYQDPEDSPLTDEDRATFEHLAYYPASPDFRFEARIERTPEAVPIDMATVSGVNKTYQRWANLHFTYQGQDYHLPAYRRLNNQTGELGDYLFIPFKDHTTGNTSYGGGRYIDMELPKDRATTVILDFNHAYNPYCAYSTGWSCPIPPAECYVDFPVRAGVMAWDKGTH